MMLVLLEGIGLAIYRSQVRVLAGYHCVVALGKPLTLVCLCHQAVELVPAKEGGDVEMSL